jgi:hypothetical protein
MAARYVIGIDLGTTNSVLAFTPLNLAGDGEQDGAAAIELLSIPQLVDAGLLESRTSLPSFMYLASEHEANTPALALPWSEQNDFVVGEWARRRSAEAPQRTVGAAKSWLGHSRVDRNQAILPWNAPEDVVKVSPVTASQRYLEHLIAAWQHAFPDAPLREQQVVLTVPASFDASARELTRSAALAAGLPEDFVLLEEPQAALYAWLADAGEAWRRKLKLDDTLLVCDIGGGTTDLTLVRVAEEQGELVLRRIAVGNHLLVGGDNMDLTLAHYVAERFKAEKNLTLDPWQSVSLWHSCRTAKETLLAPSGPEKHPIAILGRGSKLIGGTVSIEVECTAAAALLVEGFFPQCELTASPARRRASGFQEIGLPFESDVAITRHLASFLRLHGGENEPVRPTHLLLNGGAFKGEVLRERLIGTLHGWFPSDAAPQLLDATPDLDHAVARGAAFYALTKTGGGVRIRGGTARAYYVGVESAGLAIPGAPRPLRALCVVPLGMEEGTSADVSSSEIGLVVGETAHFRFFASPVRKQDQPGTLLASWDENELSETDSLEALLPAEDSGEEEFVPVRFHSRITELGVLELWCVSAQDDRRWKLEFSVREEP